MKPTTLPSSLLRPVPVVVCAAAFTVLAVQSSCAGHADGRASAVLTQSQARAALTRYVEVSNAARAAAASGDLTTARALTGEVETGPQLAQSLARYSTLQVAAAKVRRDTLSPVSYSHAHVFIPGKIAGQEPWFEAISSPRGTAGTALVFVRSSDGVWRMSAAVGLDGPVPGVVTKGGRATAVAPDTTGLAMRPDQLHQAVNDDYVSGGRSAGDGLMATAAVEEQRGAQVRLNRMLWPDAVAAAYPAHDPYQSSVWALATADGGAFVIASRALDWNFVAITPGAYVTMPAGVAVRPWVRGRSADVTVSYACVTAAEIPRTGWTLQVGDHCDVVRAEG